MTEATPSPTTPEELEAIRARAEAATPWPWRSQKGHGDKWRVEAAGHTVCKVWTHNMTKNAPFIAHAREDVPALLAHSDAIARDLAEAKRRLAEAERERDEARATADSIRQLWERAIEIGSRSIAARDARIVQLEGALSETSTMLEAVAMQLRLWGPEPVVAYERRLAENAALSAAPSPPDAREAVVPWGDEISIWPTNDPRTWRAKWRRNGCPPTQLHIDHPTPHAALDAALAETVRALAEREG